MIKLSDLIDLQQQASEPARLKNFLYRGSREQNSEMQPNRFNIGTGGTVEEIDVLTTDHPENTNTSQRYNNGYPWKVPDAGGIFDENISNDLKDALLGREYQTLEDLAKMYSRLKQAGNAQSDIEQFILNYINQ